nr:sensor histidine kinase [Pedobacter panaciterrae]
MRRFLLLIALILFTKIQAIAQVIYVNDKTPYSNIGRQVTYIEDKTALLTVDEVKTLDKAGKFKPGESNILNLGNTSSAFWIKINYVNQSSGKAYLIIDVPNIEHLDCYADKMDGTQLHLKSGFLTPSTTGVKSENRYTFSLPRGNNQTDIQQVFLRVKSDNYLPLPLKMATSDTLVSGPNFRDYLEIIFMGVLLSLLVFNIFLYMSMKDNIYLYYCLYVPGLFIYVSLYLRGYAYLLSPELRRVINLYPHAFLAITMIFGILFCRRFLNLRVTAPKFLRIYQILIFFCIALFFVSILGYKSIAADYTQISMFIYPIILWFSGYIAYKRGHTPAKYYILAWSFITLAIIIVILTLVKVFPFTDYTFDLLPVGSAIELLLLSFAMGYRYNVVIKRERETRDENLMLVSDQNLHLENLVKERTLKLSETISELQISNSVKNKLFSIIAHDLRSPFNSLTGIFALKDMDMLTLEDYKMLLTENQKHIETINSSLNNLLYWARRQMEVVNSVPTTFDLKPFIEELLLVYLPLIHKKGITTDIDLSESFSAYADEDHVQLILRNLIDNAIKFTTTGNRIGIVLKKQDDMVEICVWNTINNPEQFDLEHIRNPKAEGATYGTENEKGMGLGLNLIREYIKANGSKLNIDLIGNQVFFSFDLPLSSSHPL